MPIFKLLSFASLENSASSPSSNRRSPFGVFSSSTGPPRPPTVLACSALHRDNGGSDLSFPVRKLCDDRRPVFDHLRPNKFFRNVIRITAIQSGNAVTSYYSDLLKLDLEREDRIASGELTPEDAVSESEKWQEREWSRRMEGIRERIGLAFVKYHAVVLTMRLYEHIASLYVDNVVLDALTMDTYECAKREARSKDGSDMGRSMMATCWSANLISFLADYSVHQVILTYGYYCYVQHQRKKIKGPDDTEEVHQGSVALSFLRKSAHLAVSRLVGLGFSSVGGGIGSMVWPGWGTLVGTNLGDSLALQFTEDTTGTEQRSTEAP